VACDRSVVSPGTPVSPNNKTDRHDITEMLLKVALNTINYTTNHQNKITWIFDKFLGFKYPFSKDSLSDT
jgi:hypothetical protein